MTKAAIFRLFKYPGVFNQSYYYTPTTLVLYIIPVLHSLQNIHISENNQIPNFKDVHESDLFYLPYVSLLFFSFVLSFMFDGVDWG